MFWFVWWIYHWSNLLKTRKSLLTYLIIFCWGIFFFNFYIFKLFFLIFRIIRYLTYRLANLGIRIIFCWISKFIFKSIYQLWTVRLLKVLYLYSKNLTYLCFYVHIIKLTFVRMAFIWITFIFQSWQGSLHLSTLWLTRCFILCLLFATLS